MDKLREAIENFRSVDEGMFGNIAHRVGTAVSGARSVYKGNRQGGGSHPGAAKPAGRVASAARAVKYGAKRFRDPGPRPMADF